MTSHSSSDRSAFTLIEMLIVLMVVGLLAGVGSLSFGGFRTATVGIPDDLDALTTDLRCDASRSDILAIAGCPPQAPRRHCLNRSPAPHR